MAYKRRDETKNSQINDADRDRIIQVLSLEYQILRQEMVLRTSGRYQFLGLMTTAAALLTTGVFETSVFRSRTWISAGLAALVFAFGVVSFVYLGRQRVLTQIRVAAIEKRINALVPAEPGFSSVLMRESDREHWTYYRKLKLIFLGTRAL
jgi:hypothetical protein